MATTLDIGQIIRLRVFTYLNGQVGLNVLHYVVTAKTSTGGTLEDAAVEFSELIGGVLPDCIATPAEYLGVTVQKIGPGTPTLQIISTLGHAFGTAGDQPAPTQISGLISWHTVFGGPAYRGRTYVPFPATDDVTTEGHPSESYRTRVNAYAAVLQGPWTIETGAGDSTLELVLYHLAASTVTDITTGNASSRWATQRRRGDYGTLNPKPF